MKISPIFNIKIRSAQKSDEVVLLAWANDALVRENSFNSEAIKVSIHHGWLSSRLKNYEHCRIFMCETENGIAIGQVRFERKGLDWEIDYSIDSAFRGNKLGMKMLKMALEKFREDFPGSRFVGLVKKENVPSLNIFRELEFTLEFKGDFFICRSLENASI